MKFFGISCLFSLIAAISAFHVPSTHTQQGSLLQNRLGQVVLFATPPEDETWVDPKDLKTPKGTNRRDLIINAVGVGLLGASGWASASLYKTNVYTPDGFQRIYPTQFIAALGDPKAKEGKEAQEWGLWRVDPGPRGVWLKQYESQLAQQDNVAPAGWKFDPNNWWVEEHGLIMEAPDFPLSPGRYLVTGGRTTTTGLTIDAKGGWKLDEGSLYDVTHLPCRSAKYTPDASSSTNGSPLTANPSNFPVSPGAAMPPVQGCNKQDYAVLFVVGKVLGNSENRA
ncbi:MAG: hypothetical protein SGBAC_005345 [Bacillariaceae sp.]